MAEVVLLDTGPLVALLDRREWHHRWAVEQMGRLRLPLFSCEAVATEACFLLDEHPVALRQIEIDAEEGSVKLRPLSADAFVRASLRT